MERHTRRAFTLTELLIVLAIIATLLLILFPAVARIRETANRLRCQNNLKQIGTAFHTYHETYNAFPPAQLNDPKYVKSGQQSAVSNQSAPRSTPHAPPFPYLSWRGYLLPFVGQDDLWKQTEQAFGQTPDFWRSPPHVGLGMRMQVYTCPSDSREDRQYQPPYPDLYPQPMSGPLTTHHSPLTLGMSPVTLSGYLAVSGTNLTTKDGVVFYNKWIKIQQIKDGTGNTIMVGERPAVQPYVFGWWYAGVGQFLPRRQGPVELVLAQRYAFDGTFTGSASQTLGVAELNMQSSGYSAYDNCPPGPYTYGPGSYKNPCDIFHFWSLHPGGAHFLFGDGSVHFLNYSIGDDLVKLATRAGREI